MPDASEKKTQVIIGFRQRAHGRPGIVGRSLLVDGYGRAESFNVINVGFLHLPQELAGIGRKRLNVAALPLGIYGVESQRALPRPGDTGDDHQFVPGDDYVYVFEVVLSGTLDKYGIGHGALIVTLVLRLLKRKALALLGGVYSVGQADERSAIMPAPVKPVKSGHQSALVPAPA